MITVFMAMSGGLDSSFAAYLLKQQGYKVVGVTFRLSPEPGKSTSPFSVCQSMEAIRRAQRAAHELSITHHILDLREDFQRSVIDPFINGYKTGYTPNPCVLCNQYIKFGAFARKAFSLGAERIATGHYAIVSEFDNQYYLRKATDATKDQSYFLYAINKGILKKTLFPLGKYTKDNVREEARKRGWNIHSLQESQDICFIPDNNYRAFLAPYIPNKEGPIYHTDGTLLGKHEGTHLYTIGQRRGLAIPYTKPLYVVDILPGENAVVVGDRERLCHTRLVASGINILWDNPPSGQVTGKVRYRQREMPCSYTAVENRLEVSFLKPVNAITPGQSVVLYSRDAVIGGGVIERTTNGRLPITNPS